MYVHTYAWPVKTVAQEVRYCSNAMLHSSHSHDNTLLVSLLNPMFTISSRPQKSPYIWFTTNYYKARLFNLKLYVIKPFIIVSTYLRTITGILVFLKIREHIALDHT